MINPIKIAELLERIGRIVELKAKRLSPIDLGLLRASIKHRVDGNGVIIYSDAPYARDMEFGTPPGVLSKQEKDELTAWAKRHKLPAGPVIRKIEREGIKVGSPEKPLSTFGTFRPFLRPALIQSIPEIKEAVKEVLRD